jgi:hypothetical protein
MALGIRGVNPRRGDFITLRTRPPHTRQDGCAWSNVRSGEIEAAQAAAIKAAAATPARPSEEDSPEGSTGRVALLTRLRGLGPIGAVVLGREYSTGTSTTAGKSPAISG